MRSEHRRDESSFLAPDMVSERNVKLAMFLAVLSALVGTTAHGHIFTAFNYEIFGNNAAVGLLDSVSGGISFLVAGPVGWAVDFLPRTRLLRICAGIGLVAALSGASAVVLGARLFGLVADGAVREHPGWRYTSLLVTSLAFWGVFFSATSSVSLALLADSMPRRSRQARQDLYAKKSTLSLLALGAGPLVAFLSTLRYGNDWEVGHMAYALLPGFMLMPVMCFLLTCFEEVSVDHESLAALEEALLSKDERQCSGTSAPRAAAAGHQATANRGAMLETLAVGDTAAGARVPYLLLTAELISAFGAGMTVKFFGLWFKNEFHFSPRGLSLLQAASPVSCAITVQVLSRVARRSRWGPIPVVLCFWMTSVGCLLAMVRVNQWQMLVALHLLRTSFANCKEPVARAILADFVPAKKRGRWNALHSLTSISWSGSAALGGFLCDRYGYGRTFVLTAGLYVLAMLFWLPLIRLVPHEGGTARAKCT